MKRMRKAVASARLALAAFFLMAVSLSAAHAQTTEIRLSISSSSPARVRVQGERTAGTKMWAFRNSYAGVLGIGERVENLALTNSAGESVQIRKTAPGEYEADREATRFSYDVRLEPPAQTSNSAYVSWIAGERGFLMLGDLLPRAALENASAQPLTLRLELPMGWMAYANETKATDGAFKIEDRERAVFFVGKELRERRGRAGAMDFSVVTGGDWAFSDEDLAEAIKDVLREHEHTLGGPARPRVTVMLAPFPRAMSAERWSAETRGATVVLLAGRSPSKIAGLTQLSVPLTHELFHLWVPNALSLDGAYDWFYEGFTLYQAMRAGVRLGTLTFDDYLRAVGRAYDIYMSSNERDRWSLIEASERRWSGATALVYNKGMVVAFLYDLGLRQQSNGKRSLDNVYRELFRLYGRTGVRKEGNTVALAALKEAAEMRDFVRQFVEAASPIELAKSIAPYGLQVQPGGARTHVSVADSLSRQQRDLLRQLGYNEKTDRGARGARRR